MNAHVHGDAPVDPFAERLNPAQYRAATYGAPSSAGFSAGPLLIIAGAGTGKTNTLAHRVAHLLLEGRRARANPAADIHASRRAGDAAPGGAHRRRGTARPSRSRESPAATPRGCSGPAPFTRSATGCCASTRRSSGWSPRSRCSIAATPPTCWIFCARSSGFAKKEKRFPRKDTCLAIYSHRVNSRAAAGADARGRLSLVQRLGRRADAAVPPLCRGQTRAAAARLRRPAALLAHPRAGAAARARDRRALRARADRRVPGHEHAAGARSCCAMKPDGAGVCVVGDDAQAIYSFRAATVDNILDFPARFAPPAQIVKLEQNYRSVQPILDAANALMSDSARQYQKELRSDRAVGAASRATSPCRTIRRRRCTSSSRCSRRASRARCCDVRRC